jgi:hypothetical protein
MSIRAGSFVCRRDMRCLADGRDLGKSSTWALPWAYSGTNGRPIVPSGSRGSVAKYTASREQPCPLPHP